MSKFLFNKLNHLITTRASASLTLAFSPTHNLFYFSLQRHPFSSSLSSLSVKAIEKSSKRRAFTVDYLIKSCGLPPKRALSASKYMNFEGANKPDSVLTFLKDHGFTQTQVSRLVNCYPRVLLSYPEKTLLPKLEFFRSKGFSDSDIAEIICTWPNILERSLENQLIPSFNFFSDLLQSYGKKTINAFKRCVGVLLFDLEKHGASNIKTLEKVGVPSKNIGYLLANQPRVLMTTCDKFRQIVDKVIDMDFDPPNIKFTLAVHALRSMSKSTWDRKVMVYKTWGWSDNDIVAAFRRHPLCMTSSEEKIKLAMEFWVNKMEWKSSALVFSPKCLSYSLEKRVKPRCEIYQFLVSNGLLNPATGFATMLNYSEKGFLEKFVDPHKEKAPHLLKLYKQKLVLAKRKTKLL